MVLERGALALLVVAVATTGGALAWRGRPRPPGPAGAERGAVSGRLTRGDGRGLPAALWLTRAGDAAAPPAGLFREARTSDTGAFQFAAVPDGVYRIAFLPDDGEECGGWSAPFAATAARDLRVTLESGRDSCTTVAGRIDRVAPGAARPAAWLFATLDAEQFFPAPAFRLPLDASGGYRARLPAGAYARFLVADTVVTRDDVSSEGDPTGSWRAPRIVSVEASFPPAAPPSSLPIEALVFVEPHVTAPPYRAVVRDGRIALPVAAGARVIVSATNGDSLWTGESRVALESDRTAIRLQRSQAPEVRGTVRFDDGRPASGASVELTHPQLRNHAVTTTADAQGHFVVRPLWRGTLFLRVRAAGAATRVEEIAVDQRGRVEHDVRLSTACVVRGTVRREGGTPARDALVMARPANGRAGRVATTTDDAGAFVLESLPAERLRLYAEHGEREVTELDHDCSARPVALTLERMGTIGGRVLFDDGTPAAGAHVHAVLWEGQDTYWPCCSATVDGNGRYAITTSKTGRYVVAASRTPALSFVPGLIHRWQRNVEIRAPGARAEVDLRVPRGGHRLSGSVVGPGPAPGGRPLPAVELTAFREVLGSLQPAARPVTSDDLGRFDLADLQEGSYTVLAAHPDFPDHWTEVRLSRARTELRVVMAPGVRLRGGIAPATDRRRRAVRAWAVPLPDPTDSPALSALRRQRAPQAPLAPDESTFAFPPLAPGRYEIRIRGNRGPSASRVVTIAADRPPAPLHLEAGEGLTSLSGRVLDIDGRPVPGAKVTVSETPGVHATVTTGADGRFTIGETPPIALADLDVAPAHDEFFADHWLLRSRPVKRARAFRPVMVVSRAIDQSRQAGILVARRQGLPSVWGVAPELQESLHIQEGDTVLTVRGIAARDLGDVGVNLLLRARDRAETVPVELLGREGRPRRLALPTVDEAIALAAAPP